MHTGDKNESMDVGGVIPLTTNRRSVVGHNYFTRSKSSLNTEEAHKGTDTKPDDGERVLGPNSPMSVKDALESKESRKRGHGDLRQNTSSPNNPPAKSYKNTTSNMSFMEDKSASTSRVCFSSSTTSLSKGELGGTHRHPVYRKSPAANAKGGYDLYRSVSGESEISFAVVDTSSPWDIADSSLDARESKTEDGDMQWLSFRDQKRDSDDHNEIFRFGEDGESCEELPRVIISLSDVNVPDVPRNRVLLNYNRDGTIDLLGEGEYGYVVRGILKGSLGDQDIVAKYFKKDRSSLDDILDEARILLYLQDTGYVPRVHGLIESSRKDCDPILVQECFGDGVTLDDLLERKVGKKTWLSICLQVANGLLKIHQKGVLINDIKLDNVLVDYHGSCQQIRFIDMGIATYRSSYVSSGSETTMAECSHLAPEVRKLKPSSPKSDIYGLGYVMKTIGRDAFIEELVSLGNKLMAEKPHHRYSLPKTITCLNSLLRSL